MSVRRPVAVVTGVCRGCGAEIAVQLAACGFDLALINMTGGNVQSTVNAISEHDGLATVHRADMADVSGHDALLSRIADESGPIACLVSDATLPHAPRADLLDLSAATYDQVLDRELRSTFFFTQATARRMASEPARGPRSVITVSSAGGGAASLEWGASCLSRSGLATMTRLFAQRLALSSIGVFEVRSGDRQAEVTKTGLRGSHRECVANAVAAVASGQFAFASGSVIDIDMAPPISRH